MFRSPDQYGAASVESLLLDAAKGYIPFDHQLFHRLISRQEETLAAILTVGNGPQSEWRFDISQELLDLARHLNNPVTIPFLIDLLSEEEPLDDVFDAFAELGKRAIDPLLDAYADEDDEEILSHIAFALAATGEEDSRIEKLLKERDGDETALELYHSRGEKSSEPFDLFAEYDAQGIPAIDVLTLDERFQLLESSVEEYRILAAASLFHEEFDEKGQNTLSERARTDASEIVRMHCWQALDDALDRKELVDEMIARLQDTSLSTTERSGLMIALAPLSEKTEIKKVILSFYVNPETRLKALEAMWRSLDPDFEDYFPEHLNDANIDIQRIALRGIGANGMAGEIGKVRKMFQNPDLREDALFAYAMAAPSKDSPAFLRTLYNKLEKEADGFTEEEDAVVRIALDERLRAHGKQPVFTEEQNNSPEE